MTAKAGSRGHVRWAGRMTSCVMTHDLAMPAECTGRSSTLLLVSWREPAAARAASRLFFFFFFLRVSGIPETYAKYAPGNKNKYFELSHTCTAALRRQRLETRRIPHITIILAPNITAFLFAECAHTKQGSCNSLRSCQLTSCPWTIVFWNRP